jgi:hypothetical protein
MPTTDPLSPDHRRVLEQGNAIRLKVIAARGYRTVRVQSELPGILRGLALKRLNVMAAGRESVVGPDSPDEALPWDGADSEDSDGS